MTYITLANHSGVTSKAHFSRMNIKQEFLSNVRTFDLVVKFDSEEERSAWISSSKLQLVELSYEGNEVQFAIEDLILWSYKEGGDLMLSISYDQENLPDFIAKAAIAEIDDDENRQPNI